MIPELKNIHTSSPTESLSPPRSAIPSRNPKPRLRGVSHQWAFAVSVLVGVGLVVTRSTVKGMAAAGLYASSLSFMFGASALLHRVDWSPRTEQWMQRLDKTAIYLAIAGPLTVVLWVGVEISHRAALLALVWLLTGVLIAILWSPLSPPRGTTTATFVGLGCLGVLALPAMWSQIGTTFVILVLGGGLLYTTGAILLGLRRPDPWPEVFGYHEFWHVLTLVAASMHFVAITTWVL